MRPSEFRQSGNLLRIAMKTAMKSSREGQGAQGRTDARIARRLGLGERIFIVKHERSGGWLNREMLELKSGVAQLDAGTKTIYAAYKDLRRRDRFSADFRPTPYDVWSFRHDRAFGVAPCGVDSCRDRCSYALLLHSARRSCRRSHGWWRKYTRRLPVDGTALFCLRYPANPTGNQAT